ncbi:MAG: ABC transporter permease [Ignavibacteriales bacterium CG07_land_8_20_14_0_80_59_12]|nr:MAG: ABC transporter permease [Ignavibacteriales bacterium CG07_land_8_20_14_0_80_59_12]
MEWWKIGVGIWLTAVFAVALSFPIVPEPKHWYEFPVIPGLEERARIIFFHVPVAWTTVVAFLVALWNGVKYLRTMDLEADAASSNSAGLGLLFAVLATVTGSIWARFSWGSFWNWDPRETSIFVLLLIYGAYFALRSAIESEERRARLSAVYAIIAGVTAPFFVFIMPRIMTGLHPGSRGDVQGSGPVVQFHMAPNMLLVFFAALIGFTVLFAWMMEIRLRTSRLELHFMNADSEQS